MPTDPGGTVSVAGSSAYPNFWQGWEVSTLSAANLPVTQANVAFLDDWHRYEGSKAAFNPLNTTQPEPGSFSINSAHVQSYPSANVGATATATTLHNGYYPDIVAALDSGNPYVYEVKNSTQQRNLIDQLNKWGSTSFARVFAYEQGPPVAAGDTVTVPAGGSSTTTVSGPKDPITGITDVFGSISSAFQFLFSYRFLEILGGGVLLLLGLYLLGKQLGVSVPVGPVAKAAAAVAG